MKTLKVEPGMYYKMNDGHIRFVTEVRDNPNNGEPTVIFREIKQVTGACSVTAFCKRVEGIADKGKDV